MEKIEVLFCLLAIVAVVIVVIIEKIRSERERKKWIERTDTLLSSVREMARTQFLVEPCSKCYENSMWLKDVSPNGKSITYTCQHCKKEMRAPAETRGAEGIVVAWRGLIHLLDERAKSKTDDRVNFNYQIGFDTQEAIMPYEKTTRESIPESIRSEVWRRDGGKCTECGSKEQLQFDHIIPVSKGGASTSANIQLLCRACNQKKGAKI
jgi:hypothetical protein